MLDAIRTARTYLQLKSADASPRKFLFLLIFLVAIFSLALSGFSIFLTELFYIADDPSSFVNWLGLSIVGLCLTSICVIGMRGTHLVNLELLLTYFWGITVFISGLCLSVVACFSFYAYIESWFAHAWAEPSFQGLRSYFCIPEDTVNTKCSIPYDFRNSDPWCMANYNSTDCSLIRNDAINRAVNFGRFLTLVVAIVGLVNIVIILVTIYICYQILTREVITQSMNDIINYLLLLPMAGCIGLTIYLWPLGAVFFYFSVLAKIFLGLAVAQFVALPWGIAAGRLKSQFMISTYVVLILLILGGFITAGAIGIIYSGGIDQIFTPSTSDAASVACTKNLSGCCCCDQATDRCPEWQQSEVVSLLSLDLKIAGIVALISVIYLLGALTVGLFVRNNLKNYKTDYV